MKKIGFLALLLLLPHVALAQLSGPAIVVTGDVLTVQGVTLHLYGITAPKLGQECQAKNKPYPCGNVAKTALMDLVFGGTVQCRLRPESKDGIREGECQSGGFDIAANMVHTGWAIADSMLGKKYSATEARARKAGRGLWRGKFFLAGRAN